MSGLQILVQNLFYDSSQFTLPWDTMEDQCIAEPQVWRIWDLLKFIIFFVSTLSTIDMCKFVRRKEFSKIKEAVVQLIFEKI